MNIKEISEITGTDKTTVQRWIKKIPDAKRIELDAKCIESVKTQKPADFTLEETIEIIRAGGNNTLANLLMENAKNKNALITASEQSKDSEIITALQFLYKEVAEIKQNQLKLSAPKKPKKQIALPEPEPQIISEQRDELQTCIVLWKGERFIVSKCHNDIYHWQVSAETKGNKYVRPYKDNFVSRRDALLFIKRRMGKDI